MKKNGVMKRSPLTSRHRATPVGGNYGRAAQPPGYGIDIADRASHDGPEEHAGRDRGVSLAPPSYGVELSDRATGEGGPAATPAALLGASLGPLSGELPTLLGSGLRKQRPSQPRINLMPHSTSPTTLQRQAEIYRRGKTPVQDHTGRLQAWDMRPAAAQDTGDHLGTIYQRFGDSGLANTVNGLSVTRGRSFASQAVAQAPQSVQQRIVGVGSSTASTAAPDGMSSGVVGSSVMGQMKSSSGRPMPEHQRARLSEATGDALTDVRVHNDRHADRAARMLGARAFTLGRSIYFAQNEYRPGTEAGSRLLSHEVAHTVQQKGAGMPSPSQLTVDGPASPHESQASRFADAIHSGGPVPEISAGQVTVARAMRVISFTRANDALVTNDPTAEENTAGTHFQIAQGLTAAPHFSWDADFTINGVAGDPFGDFQVGPLQVVRNFWLNIWWGTGANRTHRTSSVTVPIRDSVSTTDTWYADSLASTSFGANGDVRSTSLDDTPGVRNQPFANPDPTRTSTRGWFNWGMSFVAFLGAQDTTTAGAAGFRPLAHVYWNLSVAGNFDSTRALGSRVSVTGGGKTNRSGVIAGTNSAFPPMFGGTTFNAAANANLTTT